MSASRRPRIHVLAGVNGAGKSSIGGAAVRQHGGEYFNPDEVARALREKDPALTQADANSAAWRQGVMLLELAIEKRLANVTSCRERLSTWNTIIQTSSYPYKARSSALSAFWCFAGSMRDRLCSFH